ncbi:MAG: NAD(P)/FAD-dependent oxidoreductase, partial [Methermicoccaceae archaeon]
MPFCEKVGARFINERALGITENRVITEHGEIEFDYAVVAVGAVQNYFGIEPTLIHSVHTLDATIKTKEFIDRKNPKKIVVVGSGLTGIEVACELAEAIDCELYIVEMMERVLPTFTHRVSKVVEKVLHNMGIKVITDRRVMNIDKERVSLNDGSELDYDMVIWTAGIKPAPFVDSTPFPKIKGWIKTDEYLRVDDDFYRHIFAMGDCSWVDVRGTISTKTAIEAENQAKYIAERLKLIIDGEQSTKNKMRGYSTRASVDSPLALISLGYNRAILAYNKFCISIPSKLIYKLKKWIDTSCVKRYKE